MQKNNSTCKAPPGSLRWFREARYGMFIHYGLYSMLGRHEWAMCYERIPFEEYCNLASRFDPQRLKMDEWVGFAKEVGMRYMCLTTRHHEGFALFDTKASEFSSVKSPAGRDLVREYVDACRKAGMGIGLYYSVADWGDPGFLAGPKRDPRGWTRFVDVARTQLIELMTHYGKIAYLFYDGCPPPETWDGAAVNREIRRLQPQILISDRCGLDEDIASAEGYVMGDPGKGWETCMTSNNSCGYNRGDRDWKTPRETVRNLLMCAHQGGNFLFNVGPKGDGPFPAPAVRLLTQVGEWLKRNGEALYGTEGHPFNYADQKLSTSRGKTAYIPLHYYHGPNTVVAGVGNKVKSVRLLATRESIGFRQEGDRVFLVGLPAREPDPVFTVLAFDLDGLPKGIANPLLDGSKYQ